MRVLVMESNLMWSVRVERTLRALGHDPVVSTSFPTDRCDVAIVNLGDQGVDWPARVADLHALGVKVIGHAGHKEKDLHAVGESAGCDYLATNSELTHRLDRVLAAVMDSGGAERIRTAG